MEIVLTKDQIKFAGLIRRMETEEVKRLTFDQMLAYAVFETRTILDDLRTSEVIEVMEMMPEGGSKKRAKNRCSPGGIRWGDHGTQTRKGKAEWRGMTGHARKVAAHKRRVAQVRRRELSIMQANALRGESIHVNANTH